MAEKIDMQYFQHKQESRFLLDVAFEYQNLCESEVEINIPNLLDAICHGLPIGTIYLWDSHDDKKGIEVIHGGSIISAIKEAFDSETGYYFDFEHCVFYKLPSKRLRFPLYAILKTVDFLHIINAIDSKYHNIVHDLSSRFSKYTLPVVTTYGDGISKYLDRKVYIDLAQMNLSSQKG